ncbi:nuclear transport factor 2 family protein [Salipiger sp. P9]|uniref:nuclear transport factor 2 family protein n=1 Tax=Salipiger pentaromativorans TaxID=2943193 RepID=UPI002157C006|nr:nuclear transport factor 2 family protein [Salipiger pentaromativorans]MCR8546759.1 nuclear transport factor 2 family protein [Salipiger pentaromativorans]
MYRKHTAAALLIAALGAGTGAIAGPGADLAMAHFDAVATGAVADASAHYSDSTVFEWVGGPLDGTYTGKEAIQSVWQKFSTAQGALTAEVSNLQENANPAGATVTADVTFSGKATIPVRYVLTFRGETIVSEVWQIDPKLGSY